MVGNRLIGTGIGALLKKTPPWSNSYSIFGLPNAWIANVAEQNLPLYRAGGYSLSFWIKTNDTGEVYSETKTGTSTTYFRIGTFLGGKLNITIRDDTSANMLAKASTTPVVGGWTHVVWADRDGVCVLYINGVQDATDFNYVKNQTVTLDQSWLGREGNSLGGNIDEIAAFDKALSQEEVTRIYNAGLPTNLLADEGVAGNLLAYWRFDDAIYNAGTTQWLFPDASNHGNNAVTTGMASTAKSTDVPSGV